MYMLFTQVCITILGSTDCSYPTRTLSTDGQDDKVQFFKYTKHLCMCCSV